MQPRPMGGGDSGHDPIGWCPPFTRTFTDSWQTAHDMDTQWMTAGKCHRLPPDTFFPSDGVGVEIARRICADCPVKEPCLEYALENRIDHGVWGGCSERERRRIMRRRRLAAAAAVN